MLIKVSNAIISGMLFSCVMLKYMAPQKNIFALICQREKGGSVPGGGGLS